MNERYACYCGLYCGNCPVKASVEPAAGVLYREMKRAGFEDIVEMMPNGGAFWAFLKDMAENGTCVSCSEGSGNTQCSVRPCAQERGVTMCALCECYPCERFAEFFAIYPGLEQDNALLREKGMQAWAELQDSRRANGFTYPDARAADSVAD